jgi:hypothetical protein
MGKRSPNGAWHVKLKRSGRPLTQASLRRAADELGVAFPAEYRRFLAAHNGGVPEPGYFVYKHRKSGKMRFSWVDEICRISTSKIDSLSLRGQNAMVARYAAEGSPVPEGAFTFAYGPGSNLLMFASGGRKGEVWLKLWDEVDSDPESTPDPKQGLYRIAGTLKKFLASLCDEEAAMKKGG